LGVSPRLNSLECLFDKEGLRGFGARGLKEASETASKGMTQRGLTQQAQTIFSCVSKLWTEYLGLTNEMPSDLMRSRPVVDKATAPRPPPSQSAVLWSPNCPGRKPAVRPGTHPSLCPAPSRGFLGMILGVQLSALFMNIEICIASAAYRSGCLVSCHKTIRTHSCAPGTQALCCWLNLRIHH